MFLKCLGKQYCFDYFNVLFNFHNIIIYMTPCKLGRQLKHWGPNIKNIIIFISTLLFLGTHNFTKDFVTRPSQPITTFSAINKPSKKEYSSLNLFLSFLNLPNTSLFSL